MRGELIFSASLRKFVRVLYALLFLAWIERQRVSFRDRSQKLIN